MARIPQVTRELVSEDLREIFDELAPEPAGVGTGPMSVLNWPDDRVPSSTMFVTNRQSPRSCESWQC